MSIDRLPDLPVLLPFPTRRSSDLPKLLVTALSIVYGVTYWWTSHSAAAGVLRGGPMTDANRPASPAPGESRSEEHTSELQSRGQLVSRRLPEKKKRKAKNTTATAQ